MGHVRVGWWGGSCRGGVGHIGWGGSCGVGWVMQEVGHGVGWVMEGWGEVNARVGWGGVGHAGVGWVI